MYKLLLPLILTGTIDKIEDESVIVEIPDIQVPSQTHLPNKNTLPSDTTMFIIPAILIPCDIQEGSKIHFIIESQSVKVSCRLQLDVDTIRPHIPTYAYL